MAFLRVSARKIIRKPGLLQLMPTFNFSIWLAIKLKYGFLTERRQLKRCSQNASRKTAKTQKTAGLCVIKRFDARLLQHKNCNAFLSPHLATATQKNPASRHPNLFFKHIFCVNGSAERLLSKSKTYCGTETLRAKDAPRDLSRELYVLKLENVAKKTPALSKWWTLRKINF